MKLRPLIAAIPLLLAAGCSLSTEGIPAEGGLDWAYDLAVTAMEDQVGPANHLSYFTADYLNRDGRLTIDASRWYFHFNDQDGDYYRAVVMPSGEAYVYEEEAPYNYYVLQFTYTGRQLRGWLLKASDLYRRGTGLADDSYFHISVANSYGDGDEADIELLNESGDELAEVEINPLTGEITYFDLEN